MGCILGVSISGNSIDLLSFIKYYKVKYTLFFIILLTTLYSSAQNTSLKNAKNQVDSLFFANQVEGLELSEKMLPLAFESKDTFFITYFLDQAGELNRMLGNYDRAVEQISLCLTYKKNWEDLRDLSLSYNNLGKTYANKGQYELAANNFLSALALMEKGKDLQGQAYYLNNLGALYDLQHNYERAISYYERSLKVKKQLGDLKGIGATNTNLGISYFNLGNYSKAIECYQRSIDVHRELKDQTKLARAMSNLGKVYLEMGDTKQARAQLLKAYSMRKDFEDAQLLPNLCNNLSQFYQVSGDLDSALYYNSLSLDHAEKSGALKELRDAYVQRAELYRIKGDFKMAYEALETSRLYNDSLINEANIYAVADMEAKYNYEKNLRKIQEQELEKARTDRALKEKEAQLSYVLLGSVLILAALVFVWIALRNKKRKNELLTGQNELIKQQKQQLEVINARVSGELDVLKLTVEEKEKLLNKVFASSKEKELPPELLSLSSREMEVLGYLALGRTDEQIANSLFVSRSTVKTHLRRIYSKLLVSGRAEAVAIAHKYSLLGVQEDGKAD